MVTSVLKLPREGVWWGVGVGGGGGGGGGRGRLRYYSECFNWCFTMQIFISVRESTSYMYSVVFYRTGLYSTARAEPKREFRVRGLAARRFPREHLRTRVLALEYIPRVKTRARHVEHGDGLLT